MKSILLCLALSASAYAQYNCGLLQPIVGWNPLENALFVQPPNPFCNGCIMEVYYNDWPPFEWLSYDGKPVYVEFGRFIPVGTSHIDYWVLDAGGVPILWASTPIIFGGAQ